MAQHKYYLTEEEKENLEAQKREVFGEVKKEIKEFSTQPTKVSKVRKREQLRSL